MRTVALSRSAWLVELPEELTDPDEGPILEACRPGVPSEPGSIVLDFSQARTMNGLGASMLVKLSALAKRRRQRVLAFDADGYRDMMNMTGLDRAMSICTTREDAYAKAGTAQQQTGPPQSTRDSPRDLSHWAKPVARLQVPEKPSRAISLNVRGRRVVGPVDGFGQLWQKTYQLRVGREGVTPEEVIQALKQNFPSFQPSYNRFYPSPAGIQPGEVVLIDSFTPGGPVSTGVMVLYADDRSFTFITPQGHPESGWVTFTSFVRDGTVMAHILGLARANDPVYEVAFRTVGSDMQTRIWTYLLGSLAAHVGVPPDVTVDIRCVDTRIQWGQAVNVWHNAQVRTLLHTPLRWMRR